MASFHFDVALAAIFVVCAGCDRPQPPSTLSEPSGEPGDVAAPSAEAAVEPAATASETPEETIGLAIGMEAPSFELRDQNGQSRSLDNILKPKLTALVFYRSADWWPYCKQQLVQLRDHRQRLQAAGIQIVGISYDPVDVLKQFSDSQDIPFPLLSDEGSQTIRAYGLHFKEGLPHPATLLLDENGVIRGKLIKEGYVERHSCDELIAAAERIE